jgi:DNA polymerase V
MKSRKLYPSGKIEIFALDDTTDLRLPMIQSRIAAGFPSPADDYIEDRIDLNKELIKNPSSTFLARVSGNSMVNAGIGDRDLLIVDRSVQPRNDSILVCVIDGEFTIKKLRKVGEDYYLMPENDQFKPIKVSVENDFRIWGVVTYSIKTH